MSLANAVMRDGLDKIVKGVEKHKEQVSFSIVQVTGRAVQS